MSASPFDPYSFFGHLDRDVMIIGVLCALLVFIYAIFGNEYLVIVAIIGIFGMIIVQAIRNHKRRIQYKYEPNIVQTEI